MNRRFPPAARLAWTASLVVVLGLGIVLGSLLIRAPQQLGQPREISKAQVDTAFGNIRSGTLPTDPLTLLRLSQLLQAGGVDLTRFDLNKPFEYPVRPGDTLKKIAKAYYGSERFWTVVYLLNYDYKPLQSLLQNSNDPSGAVLPEGLVIVLVEKKP